MTKKEIKAPRVNPPPNETKKEFCNTLNNANPASVAIKAGGVANINFVNNGANAPKRIASQQIIIAAVYC